MNAPVSNVIRVGILGMVKHDYIPNAFANHPRFKIVCVADDSDRPHWTHERNQSYASKLNIPYLKDPEEAFVMYSLDAAIICSEAERHCNLAIRAAQAGLHLVIDKPLSTHLDQCDKLIDVINKSGVCSLVWNRNFLPSVLQAKSIIEKGDIGSLVSIHCDFYFAKDAGPPLRIENDNTQPINWLDRQLEAHADGSDGGVGIEPIGELQIEGIYPLAYIHYLANGALAEKVFTCMKTHFHQAHFDNNVDDLSSISLQYEGNFTATVCLGRIGNHAHPDIGEIKIHIVGTSGSAVISEARPEISVYSLNQSNKEFKNMRIANDNDKLLVDNMAQAIDSHKETILDALDARNICAAIQAAIHSGKSGEIVEVNHRA